MENIKYTQEEIIQNIKNWVDTNLYGFSFRKYQLESIYGLINNILNNKRETTIIEAPTGSGKSLICLITAGVLSKYYDKSSYILCSDLYLWKQYADFIDLHQLPFGKLKGSKGNYTCDRNSQDLTLAVCKLKGISYRQLMDLNFAISNGYDCACTCQYIKERRKAIYSSVTLMTYQLWLSYLNYTDREIFGERDIIFCDECHNIPSIIQMFCQPTISPKYHFPQLEEIISYAIDEDIVLDDIPKYTTCAISDKQHNIHVSAAYTVPGIHAELTKQFDIMYNTDDKQEILSAYTKYYYIVNACKAIAESILERLGARAKNHNKLSRTEQKIVNIIDAVKDYDESLYDFMKAISICGDECLSYLVKNNILNNDMTKKITFACSKEDLLCNEYMLKNSPYKVMLSATVGSHAAFNENIGIHYTQSKQSEMFRIPSTFDFSKSPIYYLPKYKMSKGYIDQNFEPMKQLIQHIVTSPVHINQKGIIHTGSYKNALHLYEMMPDDIRDRLYIYGSSKEKDDSLSNFELSDNGILMGPTLTEGIDLPDDGCRFIIIMKIPYPNLGDNLVVSKVKLFPNWYESETSNTVIQAIGRGNRTPEDWCTTYILDGNFGQLYQKTISQYPPELQKRFILLNN